MTLLFIRIFFTMLITFVGFYLGVLAYTPWSGAAIGFAAALTLVLLEMNLRRVSVRGLSSMVFGLLLGLVMAKLISDILTLLPLGEYVLSVSRVILTLIFSYLGAVMAMRGKDEFHLIIPYVRLKRQDRDEQIVLLDTSAIIDGRIADITKTNFFSGHLMVTRSVLQELQALADSADETKRVKGRRGMDMLRGMQEDATVELTIHEDDLPDELDVDTRLVRLAKSLDARLCTTDYNLGRIATIQGVDVLNLNELVEALKQSVFPGEEMEVKLVKEGKEPNQAVGYTGDGTMVVVANARPLIGKSLPVVVTSILPTQAGRIIFASLKNPE